MGFFWAARKSCEEEMSPVEFGGEMIWFSFYEQEEREGITGSFEAWNAEGVARIWFQHYWLFGDLGMAWLLSMSRIRIAYVFPKLFRQCGKAWPYMVALKIWLSAPAIALTWMVPSAWCRDGFGHYGWVAVQVGHHSSAFAHPSSRCQRTVVASFVSGNTYADCDKL